LVDRELTPTTDLDGLTNAHPPVPDRRPLSRWCAIKRALDPQGILNPGKILP
jgi:FAD/FMN-containing dehydrogenase